MATTEGASGSRPAAVPTAIPARSTAPLERRRSARRPSPLQVVLHPPSPAADTSLLRLSTSLRSHCRNASAAEQGRRRTMPLVDDVSELRVSLTTSDATARLMALRASRTMERELGAEAEAPARLLRLRGSTAQLLEGTPVSSPADTRHAALRRLAGLERLSSTALGASLSELRSSGDATSSGGGTLRGGVLPGGALLGVLEHGPRTSRGRGAASQAHSIHGLHVAALQLSSPLERRTSPLPLSARPSRRDEAPQRECLAPGSAPACAGGTGDQVAAAPAHGEHAPSASPCATAGMRDPRRPPSRRMARGDGLGEQHSAEQASRQASAPTEPAMSDRSANPAFHDDTCSVHICASARTPSTRLRSLSHSLHPSPSIPKPQPLIGQRGRFECRVARKSAARGRDSQLSAAHNGRVSPRLAPSGGRRYRGPPQIPSISCGERRGLHPAGRGWSAQQWRCCNRGERWTPPRDRQQRAGTAERG